MLSHPSSLQRLSSPTTIDYQHLRALVGIPRDRFVSAHVFRSPRFPFYFVFFISCLLPHTRQNPQKQRKIVTTQTHMIYFSVYSYSVSSLLRTYSTTLLLLILFRLQFARTFWVACYRPPTHPPPPLHHSSAFLDFTSTRRPQSFHIFRPLHTSVRIPVIIFLYHPPCPHPTYPSVEAHPIYRVTLCHRFVPYR